MTVKEEEEEGNEVQQSSNTKINVDRRLGADIVQYVQKKVLNAAKKDSITQQNRDVASIPLEQRLNTSDVHSVVGDIKYSVHSNDTVSTVVESE